MSGVTLPTKHATYQIVLPIIYLYCFKGKINVRVGIDIKKASNHINKMLVAQSDKYYFSLSICATYLF